MSDKKILHTIEQPAQFQFMIFCPGCKCGHGIRVGQSDGPNWTFNGNMEKPTFSPSLLIHGGKYPEEDPVTHDFARGADGQYVRGADGRLLGYKDIVCHTFIADGNIQFLGDCTHEMAGKTVPLEPF